MKKKQAPELLAAVARRLQALLLAEGLKDAQIARKLGLKPQTWSNYSEGKRPLPIDVALLLVKDYRITLDWLYRGDRAAMPHGVLTRIEQYYPSDGPASVN